MQYRINHPLPFHLLRLCRMFYHSLSVDFKDGKEDKPLSRPEAITRAVCSVVVLVAGHSRYNPSCSVLEDDCN